MWSAGALPISSATASTGRALWLPWLSIGTMQKLQRILQPHDDRTSETLGNRLVWNGLVSLSHTER